MKNLVPFKRQLNASLSPGTAGKSVSAAEWQAQILNQLFKDRGVIGQPGRITAANRPAQGRVREMTGNRRKLEVYRASNLAAAGIIIADRERYPGLMQEWARLTLERNKPMLAEKLFDSEAA